MHGQSHKSRLSVDFTHLAESIEKCKSVRYPIVSRTDVLGMRQGTGLIIMWSDLGAPSVVRTFGLVSTQ